MRSLQNTRRLHMIKSLRVATIVGIFALGLEGAGVSVSGAILNHGNDTVMKGDSSTVREIIPLWQNCISD